MTKREVDALRRAARDRDWNGCEAALERLLPAIASDAQLTLAEDLLQRRVSAFELAHPGDEWMQRMLDGHLPDLDPEYHVPGGNTLANGLDYLVEARTHARANDHDACTRSVHQSISCAVMSELDALWGGMYPKQWRMWYASPFLGKNDPTQNWFDHPAVRARDLERWNEIADRLEALLEPNHDE